LVFLEEGFMLKLLLWIIRCYFFLGLSTSKKERITRKKQSQRKSTLWKKQQRNETSLHFFTACSWVHKVVKVQCSRQRWRWQWQ